jgi:hypothetical protein
MLGFRGKKNLNFWNITSLTVRQYKYILLRNSINDTVSSSAVIMKSTIFWDDTSNLTEVHR